jgi:hypothetical protein
MVEETVQKAIRTGIVVKIAKKMVVYRPPRTWRARNQGTTMSRKIIKPLEKLSLPGESAGTGAFLMAGYWREQKLVRASSQAESLKKQATY